MDLQDFKKEYIRQELGVTEDFGSVYSFIDFGNVNHWFEEDRQDADYNSLKKTEKLEVHLEGIRDFSRYFSVDTRFYYGHDPSNQGSINFLLKTKKVFGRNRVFTKRIQKVKHYLTDKEFHLNTRNTHNDDNGIFVFLPKCNFDVEMSVDAIKLSDYYDTLCLFSSDADFVYLVEYLKSKGKKIILVKGGPVIHELKNSADLVINAQRIKRYITQKKQRPGS